MNFQTITRRALQAALAGALVAGTSLSLFSTTAFAAKHRSDPVCTLTATRVGAPLVLTSSGYTPGAAYGALFFWPGGTVGGTGTTADANGNIEVDTYAYWAGSYTAEITTTGNHASVLATCSTTVS